jgi:hypothetical protein
LLICYFVYFYLFVVQRLKVGLVGNNPSVRDLTQKNFKFLFIYNSRRLEKSDFFSLLIKSSSNGPLKPNYSLINIVSYELINLIV